MCISCSLSPCLELLNRKLWFIKEDKKGYIHFLLLCPHFLFCVPLVLFFSCWQGVWEKIRSKVSILAQFLKVICLTENVTLCNKSAKNYTYVFTSEKKIDTVSKLSFHIYILRYIPWLFIKFVEMPKPQSSGFLKY